MKKWQIWFLVVVIMGSGFLLSRDSLGQFVWQQYQKPAIALALINKNSDLAMLIGNYYFNATIGSSAYNPDIAKKAYEKAISINPGILWSHYQVARIHFAKRDFDAALREINKELEYNPENLRSLYVRGLIYGYRGEIGDLQKSEKDFRRFTEWAPKEWAGYNDLAWILSKEKKYKEAEESINKALREVLNAEENPWLWNSLGVAQLNLKEYSGARTSFKKAAELAEKLTLVDWQGAYPGNNPEEAGEGLEVFKKAIDSNLNEADLKN